MDSPGCLMGPVDPRRLPVTATNSPFCSSPPLHSALWRGEERGSAASKNGNRTLRLRFDWSLQPNVLVMAAGDSLSLSVDGQVSLGDAEGVAVLGGSSIRQQGSAVMCNKADSFGVKGECGGKAVVAEPPGSGGDVLCVVERRCCPPDGVSVVSLITSYRSLLGSACATSAACANEAHGALRVLAALGVVEALEQLTKQSRDDADDWYIVPLQSTGVPAECFSHFSFRLQPNGEVGWANELVSPRDVLSTMMVAVLLPIVTTFGVRIVGILPRLADLLSVASQQDLALCTPSAGTELCEEIQELQASAGCIVAMQTCTSTSDTLRHSPSRTLKRAEPCSPGRLISNISAAMLGKSHPSDAAVEKLHRDVAYASPRPCSSLPSVDASLNADDEDEAGSEPVSLSYIKSAIRHPLNYREKRAPTAQSVSTLGLEPTNSHSPEFSRQVASSAASTTSSQLSSSQPNNRDAVAVGTSRARSLLARLDRMKERWCGTAAATHDEHAGAFCDLRYNEAATTDASSVSSRRSSLGMGADAVTYEEPSCAEEGLGKQGGKATTALVACKATFSLCGNRIFPNIISLPEDVESGVAISFQARPMSDYMRLCKTHSMGTSMANSFLTSTGLGVSFRIECNTQTQQLNDGMAADDLGQVFESPDLVPGDAGTIGSFFTWTFTAPGVYEISDSTYPFIRARLLILPMRKPTRPLAASLSTMPESAESSTYTRDDVAATPDVATERCGENICMQQLDPSMVVPAVPMAVEVPVGPYRNYLIEWLLYLISPFAMMTSTENDPLVIRGVQDINRQLEAAGCASVKLCTSSCQAILHHFGVHVCIQGGHIAYLARGSKGPFRLRAVLGLYGELPTGLLADLSAVAAWLGATTALEWPSL